MPCFTSYGPTPSPLPPAPLTLTVAGSTSFVDAGLEQALTAVLTGGTAGDIAILCTSLVPVASAVTCYTVIANGRFDSTGSWTASNPQPGSPSSAFTYYLFGSYHTANGVWTNATYSNVVEVEATGSPASGIALDVNCAPIEPTLADGQVSTIAVSTGYPNAKLTLSQAWVYPSCTGTIPSQTFSTDANGDWSLDQAFDYPVDAGCTAQPNYATLQLWVSVGGSTSHRLSAYVYDSSPVGR